MATVSGQTRQERLLAFLIRKPKQVAYGFFGVAVLLAVLAVWLVYDSGWTYFPEVAAAGCLAGIAVGAGLWLQLAPANQVTLANARILILGVGGLAGLVVALFTAVRAWWWRDTVVFGGLAAWQGPQWWRLWVCILAELVGLALMFVSLLLARTEERSNAVLRRLLYGYNTVLSGLLLLAILVVANILIYALFPTTYNWTQTRGLYDLSPRSRSILSSLKRPIKAYVIMAREGHIYQDVQRLLDNCQAVTDRFRVEYISPDVQPEDVYKLQERYPDLAIGRGILLVSDEGGRTGRSGKPLADFIKEETLYSADTNPRARVPGAQQTLVFKGEDVILSAVRFLTGGRVKPKVYFTQDNGELDISDARHPGGAGYLRRQLQGDNFEVAQLHLRAPIRDRPPAPSAVYSREVPKDAAAVVIANPLTRLTPAAVAALRRYLRSKGGKLLVLLGFDNKERRVTVPRTGLEELLAEFNVAATPQVVLRSQRFANVTWNPALVRAIAPPDSPSPLVKALSGRDYVLPGVRLVRPLPRSSDSKTEVVLEVPVQDDVWAESDLRVLRNPFPAAERHQNGEGTSRQPLPVVVAVSDKDDTARLVVFGSSSFIINHFLPQVESSYTLFENSLEWLMGHPESLGIRPQKSDRYVLDIMRVNPARLILLPGCLLVLGVVGLGAGIWVVRRR